MTAITICGCGHPAASHTSEGCQEWRRYPEVLNERRCACLHVWAPRPKQHDRPTSNWTTQTVEGG